jgi:hypothetical protein
VLRVYPRSAILIACARLSTIFKFGLDREANSRGGREQTLGLAPDVAAVESGEKFLDSTHRPLTFTADKSARYSILCPQTRSSRRSSIAVH